MGSYIMGATNHKAWGLFMAIVSLFWLLMAIAFPEAFKERRTR